MSKIDEVINEIERFVTIGPIKEISMNQIVEIMANNRMVINTTNIKNIKNELEKRLINVDSFDLEESDIIIQPFDFTKINMDMKPLTLGSLCDRIRANEIDMQPSYQRNFVWNDTKKSRLIESLFLNIPLPSFYVDATNYDKWIVIDGLQRMNAIKEFFIDKTLKLTNLEFLGYKDKNCDEVPQSYIRRSMERTLAIIQIQSGTSEDIKYNIFKRINTGGVPLNSQEIRNALATDKTREYLEQLSNLDSFKKATYNSVSSIRMLDKELILRYIAFKQLGIEFYSKCSSYDDFMNKANQLIDELEVERLNKIRKDFDESMKTIYYIFGKLAFRKIDIENLNRINPINKGLFDTCSVIISELPWNKRQLLIQRKEKVIKLFGESMRKSKDDSKLLTYISSASLGSVKGRFFLVKELIMEALKSD